MSSSSSLPPTLQTPIWIPSTPFEQHEERTFEVLQTLSNLTPDRAVGTENSRRARQFLLSQLIRVGIRSLEEQEFEFMYGNQVMKGTNLVGVCQIGGGSKDKDKDKDNNTTPQPQPLERGNGNTQETEKEDTGTMPCFLLSAHYDTVAGCNGLDDNASGIATVLRTVELFNIAHSKNLEQLGNRFMLIVAFFDAEELGLFGSLAFVQHPPTLVKPWITKDKLTLVCNLDSLLFGDHLHLYTTDGMKGALLPYILELSQKKLSSFQSGSPLLTSPDRRPQETKTQGQSVPFSDHFPFEQKLGVPTCHIEATSWSAGHKDGFTQSVTYGSVWDTPKDTLQDILQIRGKEWVSTMKARLSTTSMLVALILGEILNGNISPR